MFYNSCKIKWIVIAVAAICKWFLVDDFEALGTIFKEACIKAYLHNGVTDTKW